MQQSFGRLLRSAGRTLDSAGTTLQDGLGPVERLAASTRVVALKGKEFQYGLQNFVSSTSSIIGDVKFGELSSAWYGTTVTGNGNSVEFGRNSAALDNAVVAATKTHAVKIGNDVTIGPNAVVRGATISDGAMIGSNAVIMPGAVIGADSYIDAGAVVEADAKVPKGQVWTGSPARYLRDLTVDEITFLRSSAATTGELSLEHYDQSTLTAEEAERHEELHWLRQRRIEAAEGTLAEVNDFDVHYDEDQQRDPDVVQYYKLSEAPEDSGIFREDNYNDEEVTQAMIKDQIAADEAEVAYLTQRAKARKVADTVRRLSAMGPHLAESRALVLDTLASEDPQAARYLHDFMTRVKASETEEGTAKLVEEFIQMDSRDFLVPDAPMHIQNLRGHVAALSE